ncbi:MAG: hypothetical protein H7839_08285 [Magnetococcus sp. YQC-5]
MNKKLMLCAALLTGAFSSFAEAGDTAKKSDFSLTVGLKGWYKDFATSTTWQGDRANNTNVLYADSDAKLSAIPNLTLKWRDFFATGSYFIPSDYDFNLGKNYFANDPVGYDIKAKGKRSDYDLSLGYMILPNVGAALGYKQVKQDWHLSVSRAGALVTEIDSKATLSGPFAGLILIAPLMDQFTLIGNLAYGLGMEWKYEPSTPKDKASYISTELSAVYRPSAMPQLGLQMGYKYQSIDTNFKMIYGDATGPDTTKGPFLGLSYTM